jgi:hypothetical protein
MKKQLVVFPLVLAFSAAILVMARHSGGTASVRIWCGHPFFRKLLDFLRPANWAFWFFVKRKNDVN